MDTVINFNDVKPNLNLFPSYLSLSECTDYAILIEEENFNKILHNCALNELGVFEATGNIKIYTEAEGKGFFGTIAGWFKKAWEVIKTLFEKLMQSIGNAITKIKNKIASSLESKILDQAKVMAKYMDGKKSFGRIHTFENLKNGFDYRSVFGNSLDKAHPDVEKMYEAASSKVGKTINTNDFGDLKKSVYEWIIGPEKEILVGDIASGKFKEELTDMIMAIKNHKTFNNQLKKPFNETKRVIMDFAKNAEKVAKEPLEAPDSDEQRKAEFISKELDENAFILTEASKDIMVNAKGAVKAVTAVAGALINAYHKKFNESVSMVLKLASIARKAKNSKAAEEVKKDERAEMIQSSDEREKEQEVDDKYGEKKTLKGNPRNRAKRPGAIAVGESALFEQEIDKLFDWEI